MVKAGLKPEEALADATSVPARTFMLDDRGRIAVGLRADLLLVRGDPTKDIRWTREIIAIWKQGVRVDRDSFRDYVAQENAAWRFGSGWRPDPGPGSTVHIRTVSGGPDGANSTMIVEGKLSSPQSWAGVLYANPRDISSLSEMSFWARGDGKSLTVSLIEAGDPPIFSYKELPIEKAWTKVSFRFSDFKIRMSKVSAIYVGPSAKGPFRFELSNPLNRGIDADPAQLMPSI